MFKTLVITFLLVSMKVEAHPLTNTLECDFDQDKVHSIGGYSCILSDITINVTNMNQSVKITGVHKENFDREDVVNIKIINSYTPYIVPEMFTEFPSIRGLEIRKSSLRRIQPFVLSQAENLTDIQIIENDIPVLEHGAFEGLDNLLFLFLIQNHIEVIEQNAFFGLQKLKGLWLAHNRFTTLPPAIFSSLINLRKVIISYSFITTLETKLFENCKQLEELILTDNKIKSIEEKFHSPLERLKVLKLKNNICVDRDFVKELEIIQHEDLYQPLSKCFLNFHQVADQRKIDNPEESVQKLTLEFHGKMRIYSDKGDILYSN